MRRRQLEGELYEDIDSSQAEKNDKRKALARKESDHLRETRVLKNRDANALKGKALSASNYEIVKVLGKGSFGVVRLVREKREDG